MTAEFFRVGRIGTSSEQLLVNALVAARSPAQFEQHHTSDSLAVAVDRPSRSADRITGVVFEVPHHQTRNLFSATRASESARQWLSITNPGISLPTTNRHKRRHLPASGQPIRALSYLPVAGHHELRELAASGQPVPSVPITTPLKISAQVRLAECKALSACWLPGM
ncbi:hypothetical protein [Xanthomonas campestris]|uniref:hypothetical protein n=1 Tax=Xanthomonas campestris TaxID=339 RepID=UPI0023EA3C32|nr:hypothetical protein [Xanthomonas campestris]